MNKRTFFKTLALSAGGLLVPQIIVPKFADSFKWKVAKPIEWELIWMTHIDGTRTIVGRLRRIKVFTHQLRKNKAGLSERLYG